MKSTTTSALCFLQDNRIGRCSHRKMTSQEDDLIGRWPHRRTTTKEDSFTVRQFHSRRPYPASTYMTELVFRLLLNWISFPLNTCIRWRVRTLSVPISTPSLISHLYFLLVQLLPVFCISGGHAWTVSRFWWTLARHCRLPRAAPWTSGWVCWWQWTDSVQ